MIVIQDVHGCLRTLEKLIEKLPDKNEKLIFVGDLIDRGPLSRQTVEFVIANGWDCVMGNHEQMMLCACDPVTYSAMLEERAERYDLHWCYNGGDPTLKSYGHDTLTKACLVPLQHIKWMRALPLFRTYPLSESCTLFVSHAAPYRRYDTLADAMQDRWDSYNGPLWHRGPPEEDQDRLYVYGHTPSSTVRFGQNYACIDTAAWHVMTALRLPSMELVQQDCIDL